VRDEATPDRLPVLARETEQAPLIQGFLDDLLYLAEVENFAALRLERIHLDGDRLRAAVSGCTGGVEPLVGRVESAGARCDGDGTWRAVLRFS
jgi:hypothetical protein